MNKLFIEIGFELGTEFDIIERLIGLWFWMIRCESDMSGHACSMFVRVRTVRVRV